MSTAAGAPAQSQFSPSGRPEKLRLGDVLVQQRLISQEQLQQTLELQRQTGKKVGRLLIETGVITEELLANGLARQMRIPFVNLKTFPFRADVVRLLPESAARRFRALVLEDKGDSLLVALGDPLDLFAFDELTRLPVWAKRVRPWCDFCNPCLRMPCRWGHLMSILSRRKMCCKSGCGLMGFCKPRPWRTNALAAHWPSGSS